MKPLYFLLNFTDQTVLSRHRSLGMAMRTYDRVLHKSFVDQVGNSLPPLEIREVSMPMSPDQKDDYTCVCKFGRTMDIPYLIAIGEHKFSKKKRKKRLTKI